QPDRGPLGAQATARVVATRFDRRRAVWAVSLHHDHQPHGRMDGAKGLERAGPGKMDRHRLAGLLRPRVVVEAWVVDAHLVGPRVVVEHLQQLAGPQANIIRIQMLSYPTSAPSL